MSVKRGRGAAMGASSLDNSPNEQPRNHFQYQPLGYAENESWFYLQNGANADFDYRYRLGLTCGDREHQSGLAQYRVLAPGLDFKVQDHVPGRPRILAPSWMGR